MKLPSFVLAACTAIATVSGPNCAHADGGRSTAGVLGGLAAGAIIGSAVAPRPYYAPAPVYVAPAYVEPEPVYEAPACYWTYGRPEWNGYRWVRPRVQVCD